MKNLKIQTQLMLGFITLLLFVAILGTVSFIQSRGLQKQTDFIYNHPMKELHLINILHTDILTIRGDMKDMINLRDEIKIDSVLNKIEISRTELSALVDSLYSIYLGPVADIDLLKTELITWNTIRIESVRLFRTGHIEEAMDRTRNGGIASKQVSRVLAALQKIDNYAGASGNRLHKHSLELANSLNSQLIIMTVLILLFSIWIYYILIKHIYRPIKILTAAANSFHSGNQNSRSSYNLKNEFGVLSDSFNLLAENIQVHLQLNEKAAKLAGLMLSEDDARKFFQATLNDLLIHTDSQIAAAYLLSDDKKTFDLFESIGLGDSTKKSFIAESHEGEFGMALLSKKVNYIREIPQDTPFIFHCSGGSLHPKEIITIPLIGSQGVIAIISLASVRNYSPEASLIIENILSTLSARVEGILAYGKIKEFSEKLENQNIELEAQKTELVSLTSELMQQNTELELQKNQLDETNHLKSSFLSNMSHELRTPLNSVIALSGVLSRRLVDKVPKEEFSYLEVIERNGKQLLALINDILDLSRIEAGREETVITKFDLSEVVTEVINMLKPQAQQKNIELLYRNKESNLIIESDSGKCFHILQNIIGNAVKFTDQGKVEVAILIADKHAIITVSDTGIGISENHIQHIFDEFRQADGSTSRRFGGTGLGLAIAKKYINMLSADITVSSTEGRGSEFTITIPINPKPGNIIPDSSKSRGSGSTKQRSPSVKNEGANLKTILLVEDSEVAIIQLKDILENNGYTLLIANGGKEALRILSDTVPDAIILDLMMPEVDGFEVLSTLREAELTADVPVLILTAKQITKEELSFLKRNNIHQLIQKGDVNYHELLEAIASMVFPEVVSVEPSLRVNEDYNVKPLVLIIEDNLDNRITTRALLDGKFQCIEAIDGEEGVKLAKINKPDLVLMDIQLPGITGIEAFSIIRKDAALQHIPIIALTASAMISDRETILAHGFNAYITKPIDETVFLKVINETLNG
jgi:signal transduction histidine kinase/CheY-like chemotaxis protein/CHASE3 domain sensor protein